MREYYDFSSAVRNPPHVVKMRERIREAGKYYTRAFDYENGIVEIREVEAVTHKVLSTQIVSIEEAHELFKQKAVK